MTGYGKNPPTHVYNRAASCSSTNACTQANGLLAGTPNPHVLYGAVPRFSEFSDNYVDLRMSNASKVDLGNNAAFAGTCARRCAIMPTTRIFSLQMSNR
jgi:endoglucanase